jgi:hypothetical protein
MSKDTIVEFRTRATSHEDPLTELLQRGARRLIAAAFSLSTVVIVSTKGNFGRFRQYGLPIGNGKFFAASKTSSQIPAMSGFAENAR